MDQLQPQIPEATDADATETDEPVLGVECALPFLLAGAEAVPLEGA